MKTIDLLGYTKQAIFCLIFIITFQSCDKEETDFLGQWQGKSYEILITPNTDFTYIDRMGSPWTGEILLTVDGETESIDKLVLQGDGAFIKEEGYGLFIGLYWNGGIFIDYKGAQYQINQGWTFNFWDATFSINATVNSINNTNKTLIISGTLSAVRIECTKGVEFTIKDRRHALHTKFEVIELNNDNNLLCIVNYDDCMFFGDGSWSKSGKYLDFNFTLYDWYAENVDYEASTHVEYFTKNNNELVFTEKINEISSNDIVNDILLDIDPAKLSQLRYRITFMVAEYDFFESSLNTQLTNQIKRQLKQEK